MNGLEHAENLYSGAVSVLFQVKRIVNFMPCRFGSDMMHEIGLERLKQKNNTT